MTGTAAPAVKAIATNTASVNVLAGLTNVFATVVAGIESSIKAVTSGATSALVSNTVGGTIAADIADAEAAVADVKQAIADARAGKWSNEPHDVIDFAKHVFAILSRSGINVPVVSSIVSALPDLPIAA